MPRKHKETKFCTDLSKLPLQYNQMAVGGLLVLDEINVQATKTMLKGLEENEDIVFIVKYMKRSSIGGIILKKLSDKEITM